MTQEGLAIWTIGHSTRTLCEFLELLAVNKIEAVADVRRFPASRKYPHFNQDRLSRSLPEVGVEYVLLPELGGRRRPRPDSHNTVWRNESFRGYADYMETEAFRAGIERLLELAHHRRTAILCAEAVWWRCHRALIADYLKAEGVSVVHILDRKTNEPHPYTSAARLVGGRLSYSPAEGQAADPALGPGALPGDSDPIGTADAGESSKNNPNRRQTIMAEKFKVGDHVTWNSEAGHVSGKIIKVHTQDVDYKGYTHHASEDAPQYEIKSDKTDHIAMHKGSTLHKLKD